MILVTAGLISALRLIATKHNFEVMKWSGLPRWMTDQLQNAMIGLTFLGYGFSLIQMRTLLLSAPLLGPQRSLFRLHFESRSR